MRQLCNVAYATRAEGLDAEELERLDEQIGMKEDPEEIAKEALRAHQEAMGLTFNDEIVPPDEEANLDIDYG
jgi:hypothetical protein